MKIYSRLLCLIGFVLYFPATAWAQGTGGTVTVSASHLGGPTPVTGTITFQPVASDGVTAISAKLSGGGLTTKKPITATVTAGAFTMPNVLDTSLSNPANVCYTVTVRDTNGLQDLGPGFTCVQPAANNTWCASGVCNFDNFVPNLGALALVTTGPPGTAGPAGSVSVGSVTTGSPGTPAVVTNSGTTSAAVLNFTIPQGAPGTGGGGSAVNAVAAFPATPFRVLGFGDSVCAGVYDSPSTLNYFNVWASTFLSTGTPTNNCVSGASVQNLATQVYAQTYLATDYSMIGSYSNDSMPGVGYANNYFYGYESLVAYAAIPDGTATGGWPSKVKGANLGCTGGVTTDQYSIGEKLPTAGNSCSFTFSGDVFYLGTSATNTSGQILSVAIDGGTAISYGPFGQGGVGQGPWIVAYNDHLGALNYNNFLVRVPLAPGRSATHTAVITCATAPCYVDYVASNGFTNGPKVLVPLGWVNGNQGNVTSDTHNAQSSALMLNYMCDQLSRDGLAVGCADLSGYVNYYLNSSAWANSLHPNNAGSAAQAAGLGFRSQQGIAPSNEPRTTHQWALAITGCNGFNTCSYSNPLFLTHPVKLESITMTLNGNLGGCTGGTYTPPNVQIANQSYARETYNFPAANLGANNFFTNLYADTLTAWNGYVYPGISSGSCSSGSNIGGNFTIDAIITYSDQ